MSILCQSALSPFPRYVRAHRPTEIRANYPHPRNRTAGLTRSMRAAQRGGPPADRNRSSRLRRVPSTPNPMKPGRPATRLVNLKRGQSALTQYRHEEKVQGQADPLCPLCPHFAPLWNATIENEENIGKRMTSLLSSIRAFLSRTKGSEYNLSPMYVGLRQQIFEVAPSRFANDRARPVWGVLMETGLPSGISTLVILADGTVSLYFSGGGGILGSGQHETARKAAGILLDAAPEFIGYMQETLDHQLPRRGQTLIYVLHDHRVSKSEFQADDLQQSNSSITPLYLKALDVVTQIRLATPRREG